jgi:cytidylate kinase
VAYEARAHGIGLNDDEALKKLCSGLEIGFMRGDQGLRLICNQVDITDLIRTPEIAMLASEVSARPGVRQFLLGLQREMGKDKGVVFEGRDMGTVVFPEADAVGPGFIGHTAVKRTGIDVGISQSTRERFAHRGFSGTGRTIYGN